MKPLIKILPFVMLLLFACSEKNFHNGKIPKRIVSNSYSTLQSSNKDDSLSVINTKVDFNQNGDTISFRSSGYGSTKIREFEYHNGKRRLTKTEKGTFIYHEDGSMDYKGDVRLPELDGMSEFIFDANGFLIESRSDTSTQPFGLLNCFNQNIKSIEKRYYNNSLYDYTSIKESYVNGKIIGTRFFNEKQENFKLVLYSNLELVDSLIQEGGDKSSFVVYKKGKKITSLNDCNTSNQNYYYDYLVGKSDSVIFLRQDSITRVSKYSRGILNEEAILNHQIDYVDFAQQKTVSQYNTEYPVFLWASDITGDLLYSNSSKYHTVEHSSETDRYILVSTLLNPRPYTMGRGYRNIYKSIPQNQGQLTRSKDWLSPNISGNILSNKLRDEGDLFKYIEERQLSDTSIEVSVRWNDVSWGYSGKEKINKKIYWKKDLPNEIPALEQYDDIYTTKNIYFSYKGDEGYVIGEYDVDGELSKRKYVYTYNKDHALISKQIRNDKTEYIVDKDIWGNVIRETELCSKEKNESFVETYKTQTEYEYSDGLLNKVTYLQMSEKYKGGWPRKISHIETYIYKGNTITKEKCQPENKGRCTKQIFQYEYYE